MASADSTMRFEIDGKIVEISGDPESFSSGELAAVERATGLDVVSFGEKLMKTDRLSALAWTALVWIAVRRNGSAESFDEFADRTPMLAILRAVREGSTTTPVPNRADRRKAAKA